MKKALALISFIALVSATPLLQDDTRPVLLAGVEEDELVIRIQKGKIKDLIYDAEKFGIRYISKTLEHANKVIMGSNPSS